MKMDQRRSARVITEFDPKDTNGLDRQGPYMQVPLVWMGLSNKRDDVLLLAYLWNQWKVYKHCGKLEGNGWFYCTSKTLERVLKMNRHAQAKSLKRLDVLGFIDRKKAPPPNGYGKGRELRWVRVRRRKIHTSVEKLMFGSSLDVERFKKALNAKGNRKTGKFRKESA